MRADPWTDQRIALLKKLWADGATAQSIADRLGGTSRSAVLGKVFRLRLGSDAGRPAPATHAEAAHDSHAEPARAKAIDIFGAAPAAAALPPPLPARRRHGGKREASPPSATMRRGKSLFELTNESCRWPHGRPGTSTFFFCGASGADLERGMPYCARHARRAYPAHARAVETASPAAAPAGKIRSRTPSAPRRRYVWRAGVRYPAPRWR